jgi:hypothetical protein
LKHKKAWAKAKWDEWKYARNQGMCYGKQWGDRQHPCTSEEKDEAHQEYLEAAEAVEAAKAKVAELKALYNQVYQEALDFFNNQFPPPPKPTPHAVNNKMLDIVDSYLGDGLPIPPEVLKELQELMKQLEEMLDGCDPALANVIDNTMKSIETYLAGKKQIFPSTMDVLKRKLQGLLEAIAGLCKE